MASPPRRRSAALVALVFAALAAWGTALVRRQPDVGALAAARLVAARDAAMEAGDPAPVRLQGTLVGVPALVAPDGREYAVQTLIVDAPDARDARDTRDARDAPGGAAPRDTAGRRRRTLPAQLFLGDGDSLVALDPTAIAWEFVPLVAAGVVEPDGRLPAELTAHLVPGLGALPRRPGARVALHGITTGTPVVAYGLLRLQEGVPTLVPPAGAPYVVTTMTPAEVQRELRRRQRAGHPLGWVLVAVGVLGALAAGAVAVRGGRREE